MSHNCLHTELAVLFTLQCQLGLAKDTVANAAHPPKRMPSSETFLPDLISAGSQQTVPLISVLCL